MPCFFFAGGEVLRTRRKLFLERPMITRWATPAANNRWRIARANGHAWSPNRQPGAILAVLQERRAQFIYSARSVGGWIANSRMGEQVLLLCCRCTPAHSQTNLSV